MILYATSVEHDNQLVINIQDDTLIHICPGTNNFGMECTVVRLKERTFHLKESVDEIIIMMHHAYSSGSPIAWARAYPKHRKL